MKKQEMIQSIIAEMQAVKQRENSAHEAAYFRARGSKTFLTIDNQVRDLTAQLGQAMAQNRTGQVTVLTKKLMETTIARDKMFENFYTSTISVCPKCNGTGYLSDRTKGIVLCPCVTREYTHRLINESGFADSMPKNFGDQSLNIFKNEQTRAEYKKIYNILSTYYERFPEVKKPNIVLCGATGTGKTYAAQVIANNLMSRGFSVLYVTAFSLIQRFRTLVQNFESVETLDALFDCDLLVIDDLGTEPIIKNISVEYLYNVINERLSHNRSFLITTNMSPADIIERYDQRLAGRILSKEKSLVIEMKSDDLRLT